MHQLDQAPKGPPRTQTIANSVCTSRLSHVHKQLPILYVRQDDFGSTLFAEVFVPVYRFERVKASYHTMYLGHQGSRILSYLCWQHTSPEYDQQMVRSRSLQPQHMPQPVEEISHA